MVPSSYRFVLPLILSGAILGALVGAAIGMLTGYCLRLWRGHRSGAQVSDVFLGALGFIVCFGVAGFVPFGEPRIERHRSSGVVSTFMARTYGHPEWAGMAGAISGVVIYELLRRHRRRDA